MSQMAMEAYTHTCTYIHIYAYIHTQTHIYIYTYVHISADAQATIFEASSACRTGLCNSVFEDFEWISNRGGCSSHSFCDNFCMSDRRLRFDLRISNRISNGSQITGHGCIVHHPVLRLAVPVTSARSLSKDGYEGNGGSVINCIYECLCASGQRFQVRTWGISSKIQARSPGSVYTHTMNRRRCALRCDQHSFYE